MSRAPRHDPAGGWHHVMNRGVDRAAIFRDDADRACFEHLIGVTCDRYEIAVHAYCLMSNHFHLLVRCPNGQVSRLLHDLTGTYARRFNHRHGRVGHLFGDRFTSRLVTTEAYILNAVCYIHRNPLAIAGVDDCADHSWSSHRAYLGLQTPQPWLETEYVSAWFDDAADFARHVGRAGNSGAVADLPTPDFLAAVDLVIAESSTLAGRSLMGQRKAIAFGAAEAVGAPSLVDHFEFANDAAMRNARWRARRQLAQRPDDRQLVQRVVSLVSNPPEEPAVAA